MTSEKNLPFGEIFAKTTSVYLYLLSEQYQHSIYAICRQYLHNIYSISTQGGVSSASSEHHHLVSCLLMTSADLSDQTKE